MCKRNPIEWHHTIPVAENIDWHLENLWNDGWKCIIPMSVEDHIEWHRKRKKAKKNSKKKGNV